MKDTVTTPAQPMLSSRTCPLCHTINQTMTSETLDAGAWWQCARCGHSWNSERLATAAAYARYAAGAV